MLSDTLAIDRPSPQPTLRPRDPRYQLDRTSDEEVLARLTDLVAEERVTVADVLCHIAEVDARRLYLHRGCSSMFVYATEVLGLSEAAAYHRIQAGRAARRHPEVFADVAAGRLHVTGLCVLAPHLDAGGEALLEAARGQPVKRIRELVAAARPEPEVPDSVTPIGGGRFAIRFTAGTSLRDKLDDARALVSHSVPDGRLAEVIERALDALIEETRKRRFAETDAPREVRRPCGKRLAPPTLRADGAAQGSGARRSRRGMRTRYIPAEVRREVAQRDQDRCTFVAEDGRRCAERAFLQLHHDDPFGRGGAHSADNVRILCAGHNALLAEADYGIEHMAEVSGRLASKRVEPLARQRGQLASKRAPHMLDSAQGLRADVVSVLVNLGFRAAAARRAVFAAAATLDERAPFELLVAAALRQLA